MLLCLTLTRTQQPLAFYLLPTRAWELLAGGGLVLVTPRWTPRSASTRAGASWVGLLAVLFCVVTFEDPQLGFPGARALLPVGAAALIVTCTAATASRWGPGRLLGAQPMVWIGRRSYALYLWHYPFLVLAAARWGPLSATERMFVLAAAALVAGVTYALVEDPVRRSGWLARRPKRSLLLGVGLAGTAMLIVALMMRTVPSPDTGVAAAAPVILTSRAPVVITTIAPSSASSASSTSGAQQATTTSNVPTASQQTDPSPTSLPGSTLPVDVTTSGVPPAPATDASIAVDNAAWPANPAPLRSLEAANMPALQAAAENDVLPSNLRPALHVAYADKPAIYDDGCILADGSTTPKDCVFGDPAGAVSVVMFGDSHMAQWFDPVDNAARTNHWRLIVLTKMGCPTADVPVTNPARAPECGPWRDHVMTRIGEIHPDLVILSAYRYQGSDDSSWRAGLDRTLTILRPLAERVLVMGDTPTPRLDVPSCVAGHPRHVGSCMSSRDAALRPGRLAAEYSAAQAHAADFVTTDDWMCTPTSCPVVIGDVLVYRDDSHLTNTAAALLTPYVEAMIRPLVPPS